MPSAFPVVVKAGLQKFNFLSHSSEEEIQRNNYSIIVNVDSIWKKRSFTKKSKILKCLKGRVLMIFFFF